MTRSAAAATLRLGASNVYLLPTGSEYVAIDAGPDYEGSWEAATAQMQSGGISPVDVHAVLVTHGHPDHCALAASWQRNAGSQVWVAPGDRAKLRSGGRDPVPVRELALDFLAANGVPKALIATARGRTEGRAAAAGRAGTGGRLRNLRSIMPEHGEWPGPLRATPAEPDQLIDTDRTISLGTLQLQPILCPGHTPASTVFLDDAAGNLYTGDHVLERIAPTPGIHFDEAGRRIRSLPQYLHSLAGIRLLAPRSVLPGHGEPFTDLRGAIDRITGVFEQRARRLLRRLGPVPASAWELSLLLYPHLRPAAAWIVMAEIAGLLDLLEDRGQVQPVVGEFRRFLSTSV